MIYVVEVNQSIKEHITYLPAHVPTKISKSVTVNHHLIQYRGHQWIYSSVVDKNVEKRVFWRMPITGKILLLTDDLWINVFLRLF